MEHLKEWLRYEPDTGHFYWIKQPTIARGRRVGTRADYKDRVNSKHYRCFCVLNKKYRAHRVAWFFIHGTPPTTHIDHANGDGEDNRSTNLRAATRADNNRNMLIPSHNTSGFKGVQFRRDMNAWRAVIYVDNKCRHVGTFKTKELAHEAYVAAAVRLHGEFANTGTGPVNQHQHSC